MIQTPPASTTYHLRHLAPPAPHITAAPRIAHLKRHFPSKKEDRRDSPLVQLCGIAHLLFRAV
jgi:hypothetical protein